MDRAFLLLLLLLLLPPVAFAGPDATASSRRSADAAKGLSTPEGPVRVYFEAFRLGDNKLLVMALAPMAAIPEFNPEQRITRPTPCLLGPRVVRTGKVKYRTEHADPERGDREVWVEVRYDPECGPTNQDRRVFYVTKLNGTWKIAAELPFWPETSPK